MFETAFMKFIKAKEAFNQRLKGPLKLRGS